MNEQEEQPDPLTTANASRFDDVQVREWLDRIEDVPDLRMAKVMRLRRAINSQSYDEEAIIDKVLRLVENEVGVLSRRDPLIE